MPISAVVKSDLFCICEKINPSCRLEPRITSFKFNRSQRPYAHDLVRREVVRHELVRHEHVTIELISGSIPLLPQLAGNDNVVL